MNFGHVRGDFSGGNTTLINEGFNTLLYGGEYEKEQLLAAMLCETFGEDTVKKGFYGFNLIDSLTNKVVEKTGRDNTEVYEEIDAFLDDIQNALYKTADLGEEYKKDTSLMEEYDALFSRFDKYYEQVNDSKMSNNVIMNAIQDCIQGTNKRCKLSQNETITDVDYKTDGSASITIGKKEEGVSYTIGQKMVEGYEDIYHRIYEINNDNKYNGTSLFKKVKDENIDYLSR